MTDEQKVKKLKESAKSDMFTELADCFDEEEFLDKLRSDDLGDAIHETADSNVSVYTHDQMEWLTENIGHADQENAIACGAKTCQEIAAYCWYESNMEDLNESVNEAKELLAQIED